MDERVQKYEQKMTKTLEGFETELTTIRQAHSRLLWQPDTTSAGCEHYCTGSKNDSDPAMGIQSDQRH